MTRSPIRKAAYEATLGVIDATLLLLALIGILSMLMSVLNTDPTDKSGWTKSGLRYYKDYGTGKEYISTPAGCLIERAQ